MLHIFCGSSPSDKLQEMIQAFSRSYPDHQFVCSKTLSPLPWGDSVLIAIDIDPDTGSDFEILRLIKKAREISPNYFYGAKAALICTSPTMLHSKTFASKVAFLTNAMGLTFVGKPLVESLTDYRNFINKQKMIDATLQEICLHDCTDLGVRLSQLELPLSTKKITAVHTSRPEVSNTYALMKAVLDQLPVETSTFSLAGQSLMDCRGCPHTLCMDLSSRGRCYYRGDILEQVFDSLLSSDTLMIACPNYNDSMPANYFAMVNRMTYIYRSRDLRHKNIYAVIVSSNSGSDMVASQVISAFCFNKGFRLPPYFALIEQACDPLSILEKDHIQSTIQRFADQIG